MKLLTLVAGSSSILQNEHVISLALGRLEGLDVVVVPTAAAFAGPERAAVSLSDLFERRGARVEALMVTDRAGATESYFVQRVERADLVVVSDGSVLHARGIFRSTPFGEAVVNAKCLVVLGEVATLFGEVMVDPRGGAPTTGLGRFSDLVVMTKSRITPRTRDLLGSHELVCALGDSGVALRGETWRVWGDAYVTRGNVEVTMDQLDPSLDERSL